MDRKWEIPRKWLIIDQMPLGEGEFGQVLRATVTSVTGISGKKKNGKINLFELLIEISIRSPDRGS